MSPEIWLCSLANYNSFMCTCAAREGTFTHNLRIRLWSEWESKSTKSTTFTAAGHILPCHESGSVHLHEAATFMISADLSSTRWCKSVETISSCTRLNIDWWFLYIQTHSSMLWGNIAKIWGRTKKKSEKHHWRQVKRG